MQLYSSSLFNDANLVSYWRFEGNSNDSKGSNNGSDTSITYNTSNGKYFQGAGLNGSSSKITYGNVLDTTTGAYTLGCWINPTSVSSLQQVIGKGGNTHDGPLIQISAAGKIISSSKGYTSNSSISSGVWTFVVVTRSISGNDINNIYINGVSDFNNSVANVNFTNTDYFAIGGRDVGDGSHGLDLFYGGKIDDAFYFSRALTAGEILALYKELTNGFFSFF